MNHILKPKAEGGLGYSSNDVYIFGRSIGTGPACLFARHFKPRGVILISAYTNISNVAANVASKWLGWMVHSHFNNVEQMKHITSPVLLIHGSKDTLIPC